MTPCRLGSGAEHPTRRGPARTQRTPRRTQDTAPSAARQTVVRKEIEDGLNAAAESSAAQALVEKALDSAPDGTLSPQQVLAHGAELLHRRLRRSNRHTPRPDSAQYSVGVLQPDQERRDRSQAPSQEESPMTEPVRTPAFRA